MLGKLHSSFNYRIDLWFPDDSGIERELAEVDDFELAMHCFQAACRKFPGQILTLRQGAKVIRQQAPAPPCG